MSAYKSQFLANMSHELRTPLNSMLLLSNLLAMNESGNLTEKQVEYAATVYAAGRDLLGLINQVLDLAKIEAGKYEVRMAPTSLAELVATLQRVFLPLARDKGLRLTMDCAPDLPPMIVTDRQRVEQIMNNLLANAIKFTERGEVGLHLQRAAADVAFHRDDLVPARCLALAVSDTGLGIAPENQERIFAPFEQVDAAPDRRYGGTGLGLNIARELSNLLGGELQMRSSLGQGSTFTCFLPLTVPNETTDAAPPSVASEPNTVQAPDRASDRDRPADRPSVSSGAAVAVREAIRGSERAADGASPANLGDITLLVIEDDRRFAEALGDIIEGQGLKYLIAPDGRTGLRMAKDVARKPKAIILDVMLPDIDGWTVMEQLRADPACASIPVHFISGVDAADHGAAMGAVGYLTKPAGRRDLIRMVQSLAPESVRRSYRILVVEKPASPGDSVYALLSGEDLKLHRVASAAQALELLERERFACMILDLAALDTDGLEFLRAVREKCGAHTPSVVVYTERALSRAEAQELESHSRSGGAEGRILRRTPPGRGPAVRAAPQGGSWSRDGGPSQRSTPPTSA